MTGANEIKPIFMRPNDLRKGDVYILKTGECDNDFDEDTIQNQVFEYMGSKMVSGMMLYDSVGEELDDEGETTVYYFNNTKTGKTISLVDELGYFNSTYLILIDDGEFIDPVQEGYYTQDLHELSKVECEVLAFVPRQDLFNISMVSQLNKRQLPEYIEKITQSYLVNNKTKLDDSDEDEDEDEQEDPNISRFWD
jgi:hypothetical protein